MTELEKLEHLNRELSKALDKNIRDFQNLNKEFAILNMNYDHLKRENEKLRKATERSEQVVY